MKTLAKKPVKAQVKHFIHTGEYTRKDLDRILDLAREIKSGAFKGRPLDGKQIALMFFNSSLRTRATFEVGIRQLGGFSSTFEVGAGVWNLETRENVTMDGTKPEHVKDAVRVLSRIFDAIAVRCFPGLENFDDDMADGVIESFRKYASIPVINMESSLYHPCQAMADMLTIRERFGKTDGVPVALMWANHIKPLPTAVPNSFAVAAQQMGCKLKIVAPKEFPLPDKVMEQLPKVEVSHDLGALKGAKVVYAKSWGSPLFYGKREEEKRVRERYKNWILNPDLMARTDDAIFMHCMPLRRNVEVTDEVLESDACAIYEEAENRLHVQKAILKELLG
jgi:N-acetylornithine carbamoyltransferase